MPDGWLHSILFINYVLLSYLLSISPRMWPLQSYGNINEFVFKIGINQNGKTPYFRRNINWLYHWICRPNVSYSTYNFCGAMTAGLKIFGPKYQKAHSYAQTGRINRLSYVPVAVFWRYTHWKVESSITLHRYRAAVIFRSADIPCMLKAWHSNTLWTFIFKNATKHILLKVAIHRHDQIGSESDPIENWVGVYVLYQLLSVGHCQRNF